MCLPIYIYLSMFARIIRDPALLTAEDLQSADAATEKAGGSAGAGFKPAGVLDFSSASEDEDPCCSRSKPSETHTGEEGRAGTTCIGNMGLYGLLQRQMAQRQRQETDSEDSSSQDEDNCEKPTMTKEQTSKTRDLSVQSREGLEEVTDGKQQKKSADFEVLPTRSQKHNNDSKNNFHKRVQFVEIRPEDDDLERFFSSEDEAPQEVIRCVKGPSPQDSKSADRWSSGRDNTTQKSLGMKKRNSPQTSGSDKTQSRDEDKNRTLDSLLGGLQHVSYTHSNQKIVGSSRAEDHLSRAAVRDVFELNKHSQQLANQLLDSSESQTSDHALKDHTDGGQTRQEYDSHLIKHPVTHTIKTSYRQKNVTVIVGETPSNMRRQQVEEMTQFFGFDSVRDFAEDILKNSSEQRLSRLRSFYSQQSPALKNIVKKAFLKPNIEPESYKQRPTSKRAHPNSSLKPQVEVPIPRVEDGTKTLKKQKMVETETSEVHLHSSTDLINNKMKMSSTGKFSSSISGHVPQSSSTSALVEESKSNITSSSQSFKDKEGPSRSSRVSTDGCVASSSTQTSSSSQITDLLGDTSILDDLFKSKRKTIDQPKDVKTSACTERAKSRGKDFWDILNEGNEESINKLTDLTEVEKICNSVSVSTKSRSNEKTESSQLWRKNEKFLWKH